MLSPFHNEEIVSKSLSIWPGWYKTQSCLKKDDPPTRLLHQSCYFPEEAHALCKILSGYKENPFKEGVVGLKV